jgi:ribosome biogenesis GTPase
LLNKADMYANAVNQAAVEAIRALNPEVAIYLTSAIDGSGVEVLRAFLKPGQTVALVGSSGVGKSSIINQLIGQDWLWTGEVNGVTGKGMHTTTARELLALKQGGLLIDNPGIREVQMWTDAQTLKESFVDFDAVAAQCQFGDCKHGTDLGCAVQEAIKTGTLSRERFVNYLKLGFELEKLTQRKKKRELTVSRRNRRELKSKGEGYRQKKGRPR